MIGPIRHLDLDGIHWAIVGGESGPGARPMHPDWAREIRELCLAAGVPFFFKQWGGRTPKAGNRSLDGREWSQWPETPGAAPSSERPVGTAARENIRRKVKPYLVGGGSGTYMMHLFVMRLFHARECDRTC